MKTKTPITTYTVEEFKKVCIMHFGKNKLYWAYLCPMCGLSQTANDLIKAGAGKNFSEVEGYWGFTCIGRFNGSKKTMFDSKFNTKKNTSKGCNYTLGGLISLPKTKIKYDNKERLFFELDIKAKK